MDNLALELYMIATVVQSNTTLALIIVAPTQLLNIYRFVMANLVLVL